MLFAFDFSQLCILGDTGDPVFLTWRWLKASFNTEKEGDRETDRRTGRARATDWDHGDVTWEWEVLCEYVFIILFSMTESSFHHVDSPQLTSACSHLNIEILWDTNISNNHVRPIHSDSQHVRCEPRRTVRTSLLFLYFSPKFSDVCDYNIFTMKSCVFFVMFFII